ncbi:hypothetical protein PFISCL1PPCAC_27179, partial [Pristionchus fissidentatus]
IQDLDMTGKRKREAPTPVDVLLRGISEEPARNVIPQGRLIRRREPDQINEIIKWEVDGISGLNDIGKNSPTVVVQGINWYIRVRTENTDRTNNQNQFSLYIYCDEKTNTEVWHADVISTIRIVNRRDRTKDLNEKFSYRFMLNQTNSGYASLITMDKLLRQDEGFILHDKVKIEATITIISTRGLRATPPLYDFTTPGATVSDGILVVGGNKLYISKQYLGLHSPVFEAMFYRGFKESRQEEVELEEVEYDEFLELLHVLYPSEKPVNATTCANLLKLADRFEIKSVLRRVEQYLGDCNDMQLSTRLKFADQYNLFDAQHKCLQQLKTIPDVNTVKNQKDFIMLSDTMRLFIAEKQITLMSKK